MEKPSRKGGREQTVCSPYCAPYSFKKACVECVWNCCELTYEFISVCALKTPETQCSTELIMAMLWLLKATETKTFPPSVFPMLRDL